MKSPRAGISQLMIQVTIMRICKRKSSPLLVHHNKSMYQWGGGRPYRRAHQTRWVTASPRGGATNRPVIVALSPSRVTKGTGTGWLFFRALGGERSAAVALQTSARPAIRSVSVLFTQLPHRAGFRGVIASAHDGHMSPVKIMSSFKVSLCETERAALQDGRLER